MTDDHAKEITAGDVPREGLAAATPKGRVEALSRRRRASSSRDSPVASMCWRQRTDSCGRFLRVDKQGFDLQVLQGALPWILSRWQSEVSTI